MSPSLAITQDSNKFCIKIHNLYLTKEFNFTINELIEEVHIANGALMTVCLNVCIQQSYVVRKFLTFLYYLAAYFLANGGTSEVEPVILILSHM